MDYVQTMRNDEVDTTKPVLLWDGQGRRIWWVGSEEETQFHCNSYLFQCGPESYLLDPGGKGHFEQVRRRVELVMDPRRVTHIVVHHQDPDLCASIPDWLAVNPNIEVFTSARAGVLIPHYGVPKERCKAVDGRTQPLAGGGELQFIPTPFCHFPGAFVTYDTVSGYMFTSDIFAALSGDWQLCVDDFETHAGLMELFHIDYMASNRAVRGFVESVEDLPVRAFCPQHGSIIRQRDVERAKDWLTGLECGLDVIYASV